MFLRDSLMLAYWFFGVVMQYKQDDVNNFVKIMQENPWVFTKEIIETVEFQDGFIVILESYIKQRNEEKKKYIKDIFLWFAQLSEHEKEEIELERILWAISIISIQGIRLLSVYKDSEHHKVLSWYEWASIWSIRIQISNKYWFDAYDDFSMNALEIVKELESLNILIENNQEKNDGTFWAYWGNIERHTKLTKFWEEFIKYITN